MSYFGSTEFDFEDPRVYMPADGDDLDADNKAKYSTKCYTLGDNISIGRFRGVSVAEGVATEIEEATPGETTKKTIFARSQKTDDDYTYRAYNEIWTIAGTEGKVWKPEKMKTVTGSTLSGPDVTVSANDFDNGTLTFVFDFAGKAYFEGLSNSEITDEEYITTFEEDVDYTITLNVTKISDHDQAEVVVSIVPGSSLETYVATNQVVVSFTFSTADVNDVPYTYTQGTDGSITLTPTPPEGYAAATGNYEVSLTQSDAVQCDGITQFDVPATGPRKISVWTSGTFYKEDIANYQQAFGNDNLEFV